jgi:DNA-binding transcriptional LysR family regulator
VLNLRSVDLNLLPVFEAVYEERNLSRAAHRLAMTQSAVSHALSRLRLLFRDELFVRQPRGVVPTRVSDSLHATLRGALTSVRECVGKTRSFDPLVAERAFFIAVSHPLGPLIAVRLRERLSRVAPGIEVVFSTRSRPIEIERALREGRIDAAVDWLLPERGRFRDVTLFDDGVVAVARSGHPALRRVRSTRELAKASFVSLRPRVEGEHPVAGLREWQQLKLHYALEVSEILEVFMVVRQSNLLGLVPVSMIKFAREVFGLQHLRAGPKIVPVPIKLVWHEDREADPAHAFLRHQIQLASKDVVSRGTRTDSTVGKGA